MRTAASSASASPACTTASSTRWRSTRRTATLSTSRISTRGDGLFNRVEFYQSGSLARVEEDTNGDGRTDKWETYAADPHGTPGEPGPIISASFDDAFRGTPTRRLVYRPDGSGVLRVEEDPDGDGIFVPSTATRGERRK